MLSRGSARAYNLLVLALVLPPVLALLALALSQEPLRGDLTRTGGYAESRFGWTQPQERFVPPLVSLDYDRPYDVVVLGDSFSLNSGGGQTDPGVYWPNWLAQRTGLSVVVLNMFEIKFSELLRHPVFATSPPRLFILASVERYLWRDHAVAVDQFMGELDRRCGGGRRDLLPLPALRPLPVQPVPWRRDVAPEIDLDQAADYLWKVARRTVFEVDATRAVKLALTRSDLFSSRAGGELLAYVDDLRKAEFTTPAILDAAHCNLVDAQNRVQGNGRTHFLYVAVPDKITAYAAHLAAPELRDLSTLESFYAREGLDQVRLLEPLRAAIECRLKDVYMPNDTHWSATGHRIAADAIVAALIGRPLPRPC